MKWDRLTHGVSIYEDVNKPYVGRKVVIVIELTPTRERERKGARSKIGLCSGISMVQVSVDTMGIVLYVVL